MVTHMVLFKFDNLEIAEQAKEKLLSMKGQVASLIDIEAGVDFTRSERSFELGLITHHKTREDLKAYASDPVHLEVAGFIRQHMSGAASADFETPA